ncbi:hypothetical protein P7K49_030052 [Saguinus oedipus]|uniref:Uncharacterized protein n=1 Tax=Saguinus oedipus TaxID=9490 RepID=A0ABQ9U130_SAGOE|nr:hypothetical protein P7K49_030052 [Saguinus oedipus]
MHRRAQGDALKGTKPNTIYLEHLMFSLGPVADSRESHYYFLFLSTEHRPRMMSSTKMNQKLNKKSQTEESSTVQLKGWHSTPSLSEDKARDSTVGDVTSDPEKGRCSDLTECLVKRSTEKQSKGHLDPMYCPVVVNSP